MTAEAHPQTNYVKIWAILLVLLAISVTGPMLGIKVVTLITAFFVAGIKAFLVAKYFMHINIQPRYIPYLLLTMLGFMVVLFAGIAPDVMKHDGLRWNNLAAKAEVERGLHGGHEGGPVAPAVPKTPEQTFKDLCSTCHGMKGDGQGPAGVALKPKPANFTDPEFWATRDKKHIEKVVREGGASVGKSPLMAPFGAGLSPDELSNLADYVMAFNPKAKGDTTPAALTSAAAAPATSASAAPATSAAAAPAASR